MDTSPGTPGISPLDPWVQCDLTRHELLSFQELTSTCWHGLEAGFLLFSLFGRASRPGEPAGVFVTAVLLPPGQAPRVLRAHARAGEHYPSLTARFASAQIHERELWEQTGLVPDGHPWLKPVRFEGARQGQMGGYPFFKVRGAEVHEVGVGPIHAGVIEPGHFRFMCHGETVHHLEIQLGYQHRGVESLLLRAAPERLTPLVESLVGDSVLAYAGAYASALESLAGQPPTAATHTSRAIGLELERLAMHLATLGGLATDIAYLQPASTYGRLRTAIINASQRVCGNRFGRGWIRPGAAAPIGDPLRRDLLATLQNFMPDLVQVNTLMRTSRSVQARFQGVGTLGAPAARDLGTTGVVARACGLELDLRRTLPGAAYGAAPLPSSQQASGDCWARMCQRMDEAVHSGHWLIDRLTGPALALDPPPAPHARPGAPGAWALRPQALCVSLAEGTRGPVMLALETDAAGRLIHAKVQDPSLANWFGLALALRHQAISDFPICNKSFDLSYCGNDL